MISEGFSNVTAVLADGTTVFANGTELFANGTELFANGTARLADGVAVFPNGTALLLNGTLVNLTQWLHTPRSYYSGLVPNLRFNGAMVAIWGLILLCQVAQLYLRQWWFSIAFICAGILEVLGFIGRVWSHYNVYNLNPFLMQMVCITIAPVFTMGGIYFQLAKMVEFYSHRFSVFPSPILYSYLFILFDVVALAVQAAGGGTAGAAAHEGKSVKHGDNIFVAGLSVQVASMIIFIFLWLLFLFRIYITTRWEHLGRRTFNPKILYSVSQADIDYLYRPKYADLRIPTRFEFRMFPLAMTFAIFLVFVRCAYRLAELHQGWRGFLITHEWYFIILDALMIALATVTLTVFHPGYAFKGRTVSLPISYGRVAAHKIQDDTHSNASSKGLGSPSLSSGDEDAQSNDSDNEKYDLHSDSGAPSRWNTLNTNFKRMVSFKRKK